MEVHASLKAEEIAFIGPIPITNSMLMAWLAILVLAVFAFFAGRNPQLVPRGAQNVMEAILEALMSLVENTAGHYARRVFPLIATLFLFILTANYMNLLPGVGTIWVTNPLLHQEQETHAMPAVPSLPSLVGVAEASSPAAPVAADPPPGGTSSSTEEHHIPETVPLLRAANADLNMTLGMGLIAFFFIHASGVYVHGLVGYIRDDLAKPVLLTPIKLVIELFVPVSLSMRLFGNIFGGEMLLTVMNLPFAALPFLILELLFGFIQALIFAVLTLIFTALATFMPAGHGAGHGDEAHGAAPAGAHGEEDAPAASPGERAPVPAHA
jgi:F-type H+-transporting ATPase subunit a